MWRNHSTVPNFQIRLRSEIVMEKFSRYSKLHNSHSTADSKHNLASHPTIFMERKIRENLFDNDEVLTVRVSIWWDFNKIQGKWNLRELFNSCCSTWNRIKIYKNHRCVMKQHLTQTYKTLTNRQRSELRVQISATRNFFHLNATRKNIC